MIPSEVSGLASILLDKKGKLKLYPASWYDNIPWNTLRLFCHFYARYFLPTIEAIEFLKQKIKGKNVIEIGAGCGDLGYHLEIPMTDNYCQRWPDVQTFYSMVGQPVIDYSQDVLEMDALEAINKFNPDYVLGAWVTQWIDPSFPPPIGGGSIYGIQEDLLLKKTGYINISAHGIHKHKKILKYPHETINLSSLRSRKEDSRENVIWIFEKLERKAAHNEM